MTPPSPAIFRITLEVSDLNRAVSQYSRLLGFDGQAVRGGRHYFDCGGVTLALLDVSLGGQSPKPGHQPLNLAVTDLEQVHAVAAELGWLATYQVHDAPAGDIVTRPWGERSFYARDPDGNHLCVVDSPTRFTGN